MKKITILFLLTLFSFFSCKQDERPVVNNNNSINKNIDVNIEEFVGDWELENNSPGINNTFSIHLQKNSSGVLEGYYCAVVRNGTKIDCSPYKEINIKTVDKQKEGYLVSFESFFGAKNGRALIKVKNNKLYWQIIKEPLGDFYCPKSVYLIKTNIEKKSNNNSKVINRKNYKSQDITLQLYKDIIESYGCGDLSISGIFVEEQNNYKIFIIENHCGDFPFKDLISVKNGKIIDKLLIESSSFDVEKFESNKLKDKQDVNFEINGLKKIQITTIHTLNDKIYSNKTNIYGMTSEGKFQQKN